MIIVRVMGEEGVRMMSKKLFIVLSFISLVACGEIEREGNYGFSRDTVETLEVHMELKNALSDAFAELELEV